MVASKLVDMEVPAQQRACQVCAKTSPPKSRNKVTVDIAVHAVRKSGGDVEGLHRRLLRPMKNIYNGGRGRPGKALADLIPDFFKREDCDCSTYADQMDAWGTLECRIRKNEIIDELLNRAKRYTLLSFFPEAIKRYKLNQWLTQALQPTLPRNNDWWVGMSTAPRVESDRFVTIESLLQCGWTPTVFAEPDSGVEKLLVPVINNPQRLGVWHNFRQMCQHALDSNKPYCLFVQDDTLFHPDSRKFTESILWPSPNTGVVSLFTNKQYSYRYPNKLGYTRPRPYGINRVQTRNFWAGQALVFPRQSVELIYNHPIAKSWLGVGKQAIKLKRKKKPHLIQNMDSAVGLILCRSHLDIYFVDPSPVHHISPHSSIAHGSNTGRRNCERCSDHSIPLADQVPTHPPVELQW